AGPSAGCEPAPSTAVQLRDEHGLLNGGIELLNQLAGATIAAQCHGAEALACQLPEAFFRERHCIRVGNVELVPRIARAIHYDLDCHVYAPSYSPEGSVLTKIGPGNRTCTRRCCAHADVKDARSRRNCAACPSTRLHSR